jgi:hypothetical protein
VLILDTDLLSILHRGRILWVAALFMLSTITAGCTPYEVYQSQAPDGTRLSVSGPLPEQSAERARRELRIEGATVHFEEWEPTTLEFSNGQAIALRAGHPSRPHRSNVVQRRTIQSPLLVFSAVQDACSRVPSALAKEIGNPASPARGAASSMAWQLLATDKSNVGGVLGGWVVQGRFPLKPEDRRLLEAALRPDQSPQTQSAAR